MTGIHDFWLFVLAGLLLNITPGPDTLYIVGRSTTQGLKGGVCAALGIGAGALVHVAAAALGLSALLTASAMAFTVVKMVGALYLLYVGIGLIRAAGVRAGSFPWRRRWRCDASFCRIPHQRAESEGGTIFPRVPAAVRGR